MMSTTEDNPSDFTSQTTVQRANEGPAPDFSMEEVSMEQGGVDGDGFPRMDKGPSVATGVGSLPSVEEVRNDPEHAPSRPGWSKRKMLLVGGGVIILLAIIIGVSVGVSNKNKNQSPVAPSSSTESGQSDDAAKLVRIEEVAAFLINEQISFESAVTTAGTPQNRAASFMAVDDLAQLEVPLFKSQPDAFKFIQRYALAVYYYALGGESWDFAMNFLTPDDTCLWFQTLRTTSGQQNNFGVQCTQGTGRVDVILMPWNNMAGKLPPEMELLTDLNFLAIPANRNITGPLTLGPLSNLEFLHVAGNKFTGSVPESLGDLTKLSSLALSDNNFTGSISSSISKLKALRFLSLDGNQITGRMDALESLTSLEYLYLEHNQIEQELTGDTLRGLVNLTQLDLSDNLLSGALPRHFMHMKALDVLDLSDNDLDGRFPPQFPRNNALNFLFLHGNDLDREIPSSILNLTALNHLDLSDNLFTGAMPDLGNLTDMVYLFLSLNDFTEGPLPEFLRQMKSLRDLSLKDTNLIGKIPTWIGELQSLLLLDLDSNKLSGQIPDEMGQLTYLGLCLLNRNELTGTIPSAISGMSNLAMLLLDNNTITGNTTAACGLPQLQVFIADCGGDSPEVNCPSSCCMECCADDGSECNDEGLLAQFDPIWEDQYQRRDYTFSEDLWFVPVAATP